MTCETGRTLWSTCTCPARHYIALLEPALGDFHVEYPDIHLDVVIDDSAVDLAAEGFDISVTRYALIDPSVDVLDLGGELCHVAAAAPRYLAGHGMPATPGDLLGHRCINWRQRAPPTRTFGSSSLTVDGRAWRRRAR